MKHAVYLPVRGFVGLKYKMYTFKTEENHECKNSKGINKTIDDDKLKYEDYKNVLFNRSYKRHEMNRIQSKDYNIRSYKISKVFLSCYDDKKHTPEDGYSKLSHFHKSTR